MNQETNLLIDCDLAASHLKLTVAHLKKLAKDNKFVQSDPQHFEVTSLLSYLSVRMDELKVKDKSSENAKLKKIEAEIRLLDLKFKEQEGLLIDKAEVKTQAVSCAILLREGLQEITERYQALLNKAQSDELKKDLNGLLKRYAGMLSQAALDDVKTAPIGS